MWALPAAYSTGAVIASFKAAAGSAFTKSLADSVSLVEKFNVAVAVIKTENIVIADILKRALTVKWSEVISINDLIRRGIAATYTEILSVADIFSNIFRGFDFSYFRKYLAYASTNNEVTLTLPVASNFPVDPSTSYYRTYLGERPT